ncbi:MAG: hypothetical protein M4579_001457 [Chaenotheca gracillima]|nr:MAG: hypothetical protein M4579_001457 [Chaenotheca gracillima]
MGLSVSAQTVICLILGLIVHRLYASFSASRHYRRFVQENGCAEPPTEFSKLPFGLSTVIRMMTTKGDFLDNFTMAKYFELGWTHKTFGSYGRQNIDTVEPLNVQTMLVTKFKDFNTGRIREMMFGSLLGYGIATSDGAFWEHSRAMMRPQFSREQVTNLHDIETELQNLLKAIAARTKDSVAEVDLLPLFYRLTFDAATEFLLGQSVNSQLASFQDLPKDTDYTPDQLVLDAQVDPRVEENQKFAEAFEYAQDFMIWRLRLGPLFWLGTNSRFRESCATVHRFADRYIDKVLHPEKYPGEKSEHAKSRKKFNLLGALAESTQDPKELRDQILQVLSGGRDTTAALLSWVFTLLARHPDAFTKLRTEVLAVVGPEGPNGVDLETMTVPKLRSITYLKWFLNETLRLYPVVPNNNRVAARDTVLPRGGGPDASQPIAVMKGDIVNWAVYGMHRREDIWGPDAAEFKPERWEGRRPGPEFVPFNSGPRTCIGQQFALNEVSFVIVRLIQRYDGITLQDPSEKIEKKVSLGLSPANGVNVRLHRASE